MYDPKNETLNVRQKAFCEEYVVHLNAKQSAINAGYSKKTATEMGYRLLQLDKVKSEVDRLLTERKRRLKITAEDVLEDLKYARDICLGKEDTHVVFRMNTKLVSQPVKKTHLPEFIKINELYMRHLGMLQTQQQEEISANKNVVINLVEDIKKEKD